MTKIVETGGTQENPAQRTEDKNVQKAQERKRVPMSIPRRKLEVPERPGYVRYWMNDYPGRIQQALQGGYDFVKTTDVDINNSSTGADSTLSGNTDMGTNISLVVGKTEQGGPLRAYLMEIKAEYYNEDQAYIQDRVDLVDKTIRRGKFKPEGESQADSENSYVKKSDYQTNFSNRRA